MITPTKQQVDFWGGLSDLSLKQKGSIQLDAVAGSGKTCTLIEGLKYCPPNSIVFAFTKNIAAELQSKIKGPYSAYTFHSYFRSILFSAFGNIKIDNWKCSNLSKKIERGIGSDCAVVAQICGLAKNSGLGIIEELTNESLVELINHHEIESNNKFNKKSTEELASIALKVMELSANDGSCIDFDDMLYMSLKGLKEGWLTINKIPMALVDEYQDVNPVQAELLSYISDRIVGSGDPMQAIYAFRGAGSNSMSELKKKFNAKEYGLTVSWRCPLKHIRLAKKFNSTIEASVTAIEGLMKTIDVSEVANEIKNDSLVICRNNAPLVRVALSLIDKNIPFSMSGKFPAEILKLAKSAKSDNVPGFADKAARWLEQRKADLEAKAMHWKIEREVDKYDSLMLILNKAVTTEDVFDAIEALTMNESGVKLYTIHGSKGLEAEHVIHLRPDLLPSRLATSKEAMQQESNLQYVASTRSKHTMIFAIEESNNG